MLVLTAYNADLLTIFESNRIESIKLGLYFFYSKKIIEANISNTD